MLKFKDNLRTMKGSRINYSFVYSALALFNDEVNVNRELDIFP